MAERRMFSKKIIDSDVFLDMPLSTQALYFHLAMRADDDGFVGNPKRIRSMISAGEDDLKLLIVKRFILTFESGVVVIKHWKIHNYIQNDRATPTTYIEEKATLTLDKKKSYTECIQNVSKMYPQYSIGKDSIDKYNIYSRDEAAKKDKSTSSVAQSVTPSLSFNSKISETIAYLNKCTGSKFSEKTSETIKHINARLTEGHTAADLKRVIDNRVKAWSEDEKMREYLRPSTLFSPTNFENYLNDSKTEYQNTARDKAGQSAGSVSSPAPYNDDEYQRDQLITTLRKMDTVFDSKFRRQRELTLLMAKGQAIDKKLELEQLEKEINGRIEDEMRKSN